VDWLVAGRNRYRSTSTIASTAAALVVEIVPCQSGSVSTVQYLYTQRSVSRSPHLTLTLPKQLGTHPINGDGHPNHVGTPLSIAWEVLQ
jgi:hypothetical protein